MDRFIGKVLDNRYEILEIIGVGGMAVVYKAKCHRLNRFVALKVLKDEYAVDDDFRRRFYDESQAVAMLSHPNIVAVYDVSRTEGIEYIVMELIDGITLKEYMGRRGALSWNEVTFFSIQIAKALEHAHGRGIVHRDIKPQNIMLLRDGTVKVADFGIARHIAKQETFNMGEAIGSVHYVSPEQAKGSHLDNRADIYSFGVVMYEMLTGRLPFEGDTPISIALQHINSIALPPSDFVPTIPPALEAITMKAMNPSLSRRYPSCTEMLYDLEGFKNDPDFRVVIPKAAPQVLDADIPLDHTRRLNNTGELDVPRFPQRRQPEAVGRVRERAVTVQEEVAAELDAREARPAKPRKEKRERESSGLPASLIFSIFAIGLFFVGAVYFMLKIINPFGDPESVKVAVPDLTGIAYEELISSSKYAHIVEDFKIVLGGYEYSTEYEAGIIFDQYPLHGSRDVNPGSTIKVTVSSGVRADTMEDWINHEYSQVYTLLVKNGFDPELIKKQEEHHDTVAAGMIIRSMPEPGEKMVPGQGIFFVVSLGKEGAMVEMPDLMGMTLEEAVLALQGAGLSLGDYVPEVRSNEPELWGKVVFQTVPAGSEVPEGTAVNVNIAEQGDDDPTTDPTTDPAGTEPTTAPPPTGVWVSITSDPYATNSDRVTKSMRFDLMETEGDIAVEIYVNSKLEYSGTHQSEQQYIMIQLTGLGNAEYGYRNNTVTFVQNGHSVDSSPEFDKPQ